MNINDKLKNIVIFLPDQEIAKYHLGKNINDRTVKDIDANLMDSGVRITYTDGSYELISGSPFIFNCPSEKKGCEHHWQEIDPGHDLVSQFNEQCEKCKLLRNWKYE